MAAGAGTVRGRRSGRAPGATLALLAAGAVAGPVLLAGCGTTTYEYDEKELTVERPSTPDRTLDDVRAAGATSATPPQSRMGENLPVPEGMPASLPFPEDAWSINLVTAHPGWFEFSVVLTDPPGPLDQVLRSALDHAHDSLVASGAPVGRNEEKDAATGERREVLDAVLAGRAVEISLVDGGHHLGYAVENAP